VTIVFHKQRARKIWKSPRIFVTLQAKKLQGTYGSIYAAIKNPPFKTNVDRNGKVIYSRQ